MKNLVCYISFFFQLALVSAQPSASLRFQRLGIEDGLPDANITCLEQDEDGFLWIGTTNGLSRHDGAEFRNFFHDTNSNSLPGNHITAIRRYDKQHLLISTTSGLSMLNTFTLEFKNFLVPSSSRMFALDNWFFVVQVDGERNIWAGTKTSLFYLSPQLKILRQFRGFDETDYNSIRMAYALDIQVVPGGLPLAFFAD